MCKSFLSTSILSTLLLAACTTLPALGVREPSSKETPRLPCPKELEKVLSGSKFKVEEKKELANRRILEDLKIPGAPFIMPPLLTDPQTPAMLLLEPINKSSQIDHEVRTARDYAEFVQREHQQTLLYISEYKNQLIPLFDGLLINPQSREIFANISFKYASIKIERPSLDHFVRSSWRRLIPEKDLKEISPMTWFLTVNPVGTPTRAVREEFYQEKIQHTRTVMDMFAVQREGGLSPQRLIITVVDVRDRGYSWDFMKQTDVLREIQRFSDLTEKNQSLLLLMDSHRVIEFTRNGVKIFE